jgi:hypothetical protein
MSPVVKNLSKIDLSISFVTKSVNSRGHQLSTTNDTLSKIHHVKILQSCQKLTLALLDGRISELAGLMPLTFPLDNPQQSSDGNPRRPLRTVRLRLVAPRCPGDVEMRPGNSIRKFL